MNHRFFLFVQAAAKQVATALMGALVGVVMFLGLMQPAAQAMPAIPAIIMPDTEPTISAESLEQKRAERRELQSKASEAANTEEKADSADSIGETLSEKLNLDEIVEENEIVDGVKEVLDPKASR